ncbi:amidase [Jatrophihabitans lederbergiae]|uniref:Amidase n=1 Tax=Jatrophihabitans lederbergiae TaxID=3075547 RepID=A0ABU2JAM5_9ACTN|nr:amidase [Jatrophihabitans sp. DSM 44399]MDT0262038.1 amidase [Jatrophihabitans sp. DSM 44399]
MRSDLAALSVAELSVLIASRDVSPVDVVSSALAAVQRHDEKLKAYIDVYGDDALDSAKRAESEIAAGHYRGSLHGIPMAIKDNIYIANRRTTMGSKIHANFVPSSDAGVISRLTGAGAVFLGKANMHEYALGGTTDNPHWGTCRNPWDLSKTPGGSSGGSAAAIASNMAVAALGSDTSGSIRIPAAICGVVGLKPTYGRVSRFGVFPEAWTLDHVGPITRTVRDAALVLDAISGHDPRDPGSLELPPTLTAKSLRDGCEGLVIGVEEDFYFADVDDAVAQSVWDSIDTLRHRGATVQAVSISGLGHTEFALTVIDTSETSTVHHANLRDRPEDFGDDVRLLLECGELPSAVDYLQAQQIRRQLRREVHRTFADVDVLVAPTLGSRTPAVGASTALVNGQQVNAIDSMIRLVGPASLLGLPCLSVPCGLVDGLPVGMQIIGPALGEQKVLDVGNALELTRPLGTHRPTAYLG